MVISCRQLFFFPAAAVLASRIQKTHSAAAAGNRSCRKIVEKCCFSRISEETLGSFFGSVLELGRPSGAWWFPGGSWYTHTHGHQSIEESKLESPKMEKNNRSYFHLMLLLIEYVFLLFIHRWCVVSALTSELQDQPISLASSGVGGRGGSP